MRGMILPTLLMLSMLIMLLIKLSKEIESSDPETNKKLKGGGR